MNTHQQNKKIQNMIEVLKKNEDLVSHCLMYRLSWNVQEQLSDEWLPCIRESLELCAKASNWTLHKSCVENNQISLVVQIDPDTSVESAFLAFQESVSMHLGKMFPEMKNKNLWATPALIVSTDHSELG